MNRHTFTHSLKSPLARRLIVAVVLFSAVVTLLTTGYQLYREYQRNMAGIETQFRQINSVHLPSITQSMWAANNKEIKLQLEGILRVPNVVYASVDDNVSYLMEVGQREDKRMVERQYTLQYKHLGQSREIGILVVAISLDNIYAQLARDATHVLVNNALHTFLVALFIFTLFYRLIARHLADVADHLRSADPVLHDAPLALARRPTSAPDELDVLVDSVNKLQTKTRSALNALQDSKARVRLVLDSTSEAILVRIPRAYAPLPTSPVCACWVMPTRATWLANRSMN